MFITVLYLILFSFNLDTYVHLNVSKIILGETSEYFKGQFTKILNNNNVLPYELLSSVEQKRLLLLLLLFKE